MQRIKFKELQKQLTEELRVTANKEEAQKKIDHFYQQLKEENTRRLYETVKIAAPDVETNFMDDKQTLLLFDGDKQALREYYDLVLATRPRMLKHQKIETSYDWDFEVDVDNYDPWEEYKLIYKDLFTRGREYFILKNIPEWRFLQVGRPESTEDETLNKYSPQRYNPRDSIFNILTQDRYFHERMTKEGKYKSQSQAIRI